MKHQLLLVFQPETLNLHFKTPQLRSNNVTANYVQTYNVWQFIILL